MTKSQPSSMKPPAQCQGRDPLARSTSTRAAAKAGVDLIYHGDWATGADLDIVAKAGMPIAPVLTSPWIGVEYGAAGEVFGDRVRDRLRAQLDTSFQDDPQCARPRHTDLERQRYRQCVGLQPREGGMARRLSCFVKQVGMTPMEAIVANTSAMPR